MPKRDSSLKDSFPSKFSNFKNSRTSVHLSHNLSAANARYSSCQLSGILSPSVSSQCLWHHLSLNLSAAPQSTYCSISQLSVPHSPYVIQYYICQCLPSPSAIVCELLTLLCTSAIRLSAFNTPLFDNKRAVRNWISNIVSLFPLRNELAMS